MVRGISLVLFLGMAGPAGAQTVRPLVDARLRYEHTRIDGFATPTSDAVTTRVRAGVEASEGRWSALVEAQGNLAIVENSFDGIHGTQTRPLIADPQSIGLYRAQLQYRTSPVTLTAGRQRIGFDDERFVGTAAIRNNGQTFDAVRAEIAPLKGVHADVTYAWSVRTVWGIDGAGGRPGRIDGDNVFATMGVTTPIGIVTGFAYLVDQDEAAVQGYRLSSQTFGARLAGKRKLGRATMAWQASHALQSDYGRNPQDYAAEYWLGDVAIDLGGPRFGGGYEILGADDGRALTSFQTPLAAVFKFNGWAEKFTPKPPDGLRDVYASAGWAWANVGALRGVGVQAIYHRFHSDRLVRHYGNEIDLLASARLGHTTASVRFADYAADRWATDTRKLWLQLDWQI